MENVSRKREIYNSIESTQANKQRKKSPDQNGRDIVHSGLVQETLQNIKIQVLDKELDVKYVKNVENEQLIEKIKAHAQFITANKEVLPFPKSDDVKQIFVSDITVTQLAG